MTYVHSYKAAKDKAINLRKDGLSYSEILEKVPVAKSTLSLWLRLVGLSKRQHQRLSEKKLQAARRGAKFVNQRRLEKTALIKSLARKEVTNLIKDPLWLSGVVLYWAEGSKEKAWRPSEKVIFSNMDYQTIILMNSWFRKHLKCPDSQFVYEIYIHENADINRAKSFWSKMLNIDTERIRVYLKRHNPNSVRKNNNSRYYGVFRIVLLRGTDLNRKIAGWIEGVIEYLN